MLIYALVKALSDYSCTHSTEQIIFLSFSKEKAEQRYMDIYCIDSIDESIPTEDEFKNVRVELRTYDLNADDSVYLQRDVYHDNLKLDKAEFIAW